MRNLLLTISYDGSNYHGWQVQKNAVTVQEVFQNAVKKLFGHNIDIKGCSRTDSGVHANKYCVSFKSDADIPCENIVMALNSYLPDDISVLSCTDVDIDFHARYNVVKKEYVYIINNSKIRNPFLRNYAFWYRYDVDADYLNEQAKAFVGTYDYSGFCSANSGVEDTVRTVYSFEVSRKGDMVYFKVSADGFLYNMVRIMVGTLLFVNEGKIKKDELKNIILSKDRKKAGKTAPAQGLYLNDVIY